VLPEHPVPRRAATVRAAEKEARVKSRTPNTRSSTAMTSEPEPDASTIGKRQNRKGSLLRLPFLFYGRPLFPLSLLAESTFFLHYMNRDLLQSNPAAKFTIVKEKEAK